MGVKRFNYGLYNSLYGDEKYILDNDDIQEFYLVGNCVVFNAEEELVKRLQLDEDDENYLEWEDLQYECEREELWDDEEYTEEEINEKTKGKKYIRTQDGEIEEDPQEWLLGCYSVKGYEYYQGTNRKIIHVTPLDEEEKFLHYVCCSKRILKKYWNQKEEKFEKDYEDCNTGEWLIYENIKGEFVVGFNSFYQNDPLLIDVCLDEGADEEYVNTFFITTSKEDVEEKFDVEI